jgi:extracellular factor (EF) 3-hydroxypalmitic acid methyl ester biosynthesis protein
LESRLKFVKILIAMTPNIPRLLDETHDLLAAGEVERGMAYIEELTAKVRQDLSQSEWADLWQSTIAPHPVTSLIHQDPFTHHCFVKPRGYAGDAELLDYIYGLLSAPRVSEIGQKIFNFSTNTAAPASVRSRCNILAETIDRVAQSHTTPPIFCQ